MSGDLPNATAGDTPKVGEGEFEEEAELLEEDTELEDSDTVEGLALDGKSNWMDTESLRSGVEGKGGVSSTPHPRALSLSLSLSLTSAR
jgi:hypothetical protein